MLVFITEAESVYSAVRTECLYKTDVFPLQKAKHIRMNCGDIFYETKPIRLCRRGCCVHTSRRRCTSTEAMRQQNPSVQLCDTKHATQQKPEGPVLYTVWLMVLTLWMLCNRDFNTDGIPHRRHLGLHYKDRGQQYVKLIMVIIMTSHDEVYKDILCYRSCEGLFTVSGSLVLCCTDCVILVSIWLCFLLCTSCGCLGVISAWHWKPHICNHYHICVSWG